MATRAILLASIALCGAEVASLVGDGGGKSSASTDQCSLYLAKSTIPGAGLGVFTGVPLEKGAYVGFGDAAIPIVDIDFHAGGSKVEFCFTFVLWSYHIYSTNYHLSLALDLN